MMKRDRLFPALLIFLLLCFAPVVCAQEKLEQQPPRYRMELVWVADSDDTHEYVFVIGSVGFRTVKGLKDFVERLPAGAILEWSPGCRRMGDEPLLSSAEELEEFKRFCEEHAVEFILHPSG